MDAMQKKLKDARAEIEAVFKKHDIAGFAVLHAPGWSEEFWTIWPSYSVLVGDFPAIRIKSKAVDYAGDTAKQLRDQANTAQMVRSLATGMGACAMQFLELANVVDQALGAEHVDYGFRPDPSKLNPGTH
jgi:hypothetical protein